MYLSLFTVAEDYTIESTDDGFVVLHLNTKFRNGLDLGDYAYPFWHSADKWDAYQYSTNLAVVFKDGVLEACYRVGSDTSLAARDTGPWNGAWVWDDDAGEQPRVALFTYLLSQENPHLESLNESYRSLEEAARTQQCMSCHAPDNAAGMDQLVLLTYPNQALGDRHGLVETFEHNDMPPSVGIEDEAVLGDLATLAKSFAAVGDEALSWESQK